MPIDKRAKAQGGIAALLLVVAVGVGTYSVPSGLPGDVYTIDVGWWNIRDFSLSSRDEGEIAQIADEIGDIDVMAVGELNDPAALAALAAQLGPTWKWASTDEKIGRTPNSAEYYGFLWDSTAVDIVGGVHVDPDPHDDFDREPAWATFRGVDDGIDFTVECVHITWGSGVAARQAEIKALPDVWRRTLAAMQGDKDLILVGDFNRNKNDSSFSTFLALTGVLRANEDTGPTVVTGTSTYDQIFLDIDDTKEWTGEWNVNPFDEKTFHDDDSQAKLHVSDHRPVWITLYWSDNDDD